MPETQREIMLHKRVREGGKVGQPWDPALNIKGGIQLAVVFLDTGEYGWEILLQVDGASPMSCISLDSRLWCAVVLFPPVGNPGKDRSLCRMYIYPTGCRDQRFDASRNLLPQWISSSDQKPLT